MFICFNKWKTYQDRMHLYASMPSPTRFNDKFSSFLEDNCLAGDPIILTGDFNIHLDVRTDSFTVKFNETL